MIHTDTLSKYIPVLEKSLKNISKQLQEPDDNAYRVFNGVPERLWDETSGKKRRECDFYQEVSAWLDERDKEWRSILYWFEIDAEQDSEEVVSKFLAFKNASPAYQVPAMKKTINANGLNVLYVGKKQNGDMKGRIYTHLGYNAPHYPGLQLHHWAKGIPFKLHIWAVWIASESYPLLEAFEKELAKHLDPLIGKHN